MAATYRGKDGPLADGLAAANLLTAADLAKAAKIARGTAGALIRGTQMTLPTVVKVVEAINDNQEPKGALKVSDLFEPSGDTRDGLKR